MKFEELENLWDGQGAAPTTPADLAAVQRILRPEIKRRGRMLGYGIFMMVFGLVVFPLLAVVNYRYAPPRHLLWHWAYLAAWMAIFLAALFYLIREVRRQRAVFRQSANTVRALTAASLASGEAEMKDYRRILRWAPVLVGFQLVNLSMLFPVSEFGWRPFALRAGATLGFSLMIGLVCARHYQRKLKPDQARQQEILRSLDAAEGAVASPSTVD